MARPPVCRFVLHQPPVMLFKPTGVPARTLAQIELGLDEFEALRLADYDGLYQEHAAEQMGVSRATFARLIETARRKVADMLLHGKALAIQGGPVMMSDQRTFECACGHRFQAPRGTGRPAECPACHGADFRRAADDRGPGRCRRRGGAAAGAGRGRCRRGPGRQSACDAPRPASAAPDQGEPA